MFVETKNLIVKEGTSYLVVERYIISSSHHLYDVKAYKSGRKQSDQ